MRSASFSGMKLSIEPHSELKRWETAGLLRRGRTAVLVGTRSPGAFALSPTTPAARRADWS
jgi:hypothetical protein